MCLMTDSGHAMDGVTGPTKSRGQGDGEDRPHPHSPVYMEAQQRDEEQVEEVPVRVQLDSAARCDWLRAYSHPSATELFNVALSCST